MAKTFTTAEVAQHSSEKDAWIIIDGKVYDVTKFINEHPGGKKILAREAGKDATEKFNKFHNAGVMATFGPRLQVGVVGSALPVAKGGADALVKSPLLSGKNEVFGDLAPFAEPAWYQDWFSPYFKESHRKLRAHVRNWIQQNSWVEHTEEWERLIDADQRPPRWAFEKLGEFGYFRTIVGPPWAVPDYPGVPSLPMGIPQSEWDIFHEMIVLDEFAASPCLGPALQGGQPFAIPPIMKYGTEKMKKELVPALYSGKITAALAITEPHAGSDVSQITTTAKLSDDRKFWIVNGEKKWITGGVWADWFTTAVRTGGPGGAGISIMMIPRTTGVTTRHLTTQGGVLAGTAYVTFEDVKVPVENVIGEVNGGFKVIMTNFNHERMLICVTVNRMSRVCYQEALHYAHTRKTFGKQLIEHPVIRDKFAQMARQIEATQAWIELIAFQMQQMPRAIQDLRLGGAIALCKLQCTRTFELCAREASQIMGGIAYTKGGVGGRVEALYRGVRGQAIPGGSEEIMADLGVRLSVKVAKQLGAKL